MKKYIIVCYGDNTHVHIDTFFGKGLCGHCKKEKNVYQCPTFSKTSGFRLFCMKCIGSASNYFTELLKFDDLQEAKDKMNAIHILGAL